MVNHPREGIDMEAWYQAQGQYEEDPGVLEGAEPTGSANRRLKGDE